LIGVHWENPKNRREDLEKIDQYQGINELTPHMQLEQGQGVGSPKKHVFQALPLGAKETFFTHKEEGGLRLRAIAHHSWGKLRRHVKSRLRYGL